jgi:hypothetical protein
MVPQGSLKKKQIAWIARSHHGGWNGWGGRLCGHPVAIGCESVKFGESGKKNIANYTKV